jgi:transposase
MARYELTDAEWKIIAPLLPNKPRGVPRADDRRVLNGIFWRLRSGAPWADIPERYGPHTTCYNRFVRWRAAGVWDKILDAVSKAYNGKIQMIDSSIVRVHQHAANGEKKVAAVVAWDAPEAGLRPKSTRLSMRSGSPSKSS